MNRLTLLLIPLFLSIVGVADAQFTLLHSFSGGSSDGLNPEPGLTVSGSTIYGITVGGGPINKGTVYSLSTSGGPITILHTFSPADGDFPYVGPTLSGTTLFGTTQNAGPNGGGGTLYSLSASGGPISVLHAFSVGTTDGQNPEAPVAVSGATVYGTTANGGPSSDGILYAISTNGGPITQLHSFSGGAGDGSHPVAGVIVSGMTLFGTTGNGGAFDNGTIYSISEGGGPIALLHTFSGGASDGDGPHGLVLGGSTLYGTTFGGEPLGGGGVFKINTDGSGYQILYTFHGPDGGSPSARLTLVGSTLFGTTSGGGASGAGVVFRLNTDGSGYRVLHSFQGSDGAYPSDLAFSGSTVYGQTFGGGADNIGTVFALTLQPATIALSASASSTSLLLHGQTSITSTLANTGSLTADAVDFTGLVAISSANGAITGSSTAGGPIANGDLASNAGLTFTGAGYSNGVLVTPVVATTTNDAIGGSAILSNTSAVSIVVGNATADQSNNPIMFGAPLTGAVLNGGSYANLESKVTATSGSGGGPMLGSTATILAGTNTIGGTDKTVSMAWRTRTQHETSLLEGGSPTHPPLLFVSSPLISDVVDLTGMSATNTSHDQTDPFVLQMTYDPGLLSDEPFSARGGQIYLAWLDPNGAGLGVAEWENAINGDFGTNVGALVNYQGGWASAGSPMNLGDWGVDVTNHVVWAVVDHNSQFAAVPEPSSLILLGLGGLVVCGSVIRKRWLILMA